MRTANRRLSKNVNNVPLNILTEKYMKRGGSREGHFYQQKKGGLVYVEIYSYEC